MVVPHPERRGVLTRAVCIPVNESAMRFGEQRAIAGYPQIRVLFTIRVRRRYQW